MSGVINSAGSKSGIINTTGKKPEPYDKLLKWMYQSLIVAAIDSVGTQGANGPSLGFSSSCGWGALFEGAQASAPSGYTTLSGFKTQQYLNVQRDNNTTEYNWSTSPAGSSSWSMCVWRHAKGIIRY